MPSYPFFLELYYGLPSLPTGTYLSFENETEIQDAEEIEFSGKTASLKAKKMRNGMLEEAISSILEPRSGRVLHRVKAFKCFVTIPNSSPCKDKEDDENE
ncbi:hypothetical protein AAC387_Pa02g2741 [Persea americana]